jgi:hypothetical protein
VAIMVSLDLEGTFDSAWLPAILQRLCEAKCPRHLYYLAQNYLKRRKAIIAINSYNMGKNITKGCAQEFCCGPIFWNIQYDTVLNIKFTYHTRAVAFADDFILMIRADSISEAENIANVEMGKITIWAGNKTKFNGEKSKVMLMTIRKRKEQKEVLVYINNKTIPQLQKLKYLEIIFDYNILFREHINYVADKCKKLIFQLAKVAKLYCRLSQKSPANNIIRRNLTPAYIRSPGMD